MGGQADDNRGAPCRAPLMQVIHAGDTDIGGGRGVAARARRLDQREPHCVAAQQHQAHLRLVYFDLEPEHITQECGSGRQFAHFQIGPAAQELGHRRILATLCAAGAGPG